MPRRCSVYGCRSNYDTESEHTTTYYLPKDKKLQEKWLRKIPNDLKGLKNPGVCINHFEEANLIRVDTVLVKGEMKTFQRERVKLKDDAVPTIFKNVPGYLSSSSHNVKRLADVEDEQMNSAIQQSILDQNAYLAKDKINSLNDISHFLGGKMFKDMNNWTYMIEGSKLFICKMAISAGCPTVTSYISINADLDFEVFTGKLKIPCSILPCKEKKVTSFNFLENILQFVENLKNSNFEEINAIQLAIAVLKMSSKFEELNQLKFITEQLSLLLVPKNNREYGNETMVLAACLYVHSRSAYFALLKSGLIMFPHPRNIQKLISNFQLSAQNLDDSVKYLENRFKNLQAHEVLVSLLMDEIYVLPDVSFKGGQIYGYSAFDSTKAAKTAQVFMISSLKSNYKDVAAIIPINNLSSEQLKTMILSLIQILEKIGFRVLCVISDNSAVNRKAFQLLTPSQTLEPYISHPLDESRSLFFLFDTVHILKCVRNNWIAKKNENRTITFPDFNNFNVTLSAQYRNLETLYNSEKLSLVKYGHTLSNKALYPSSIQKQNVKLALKILNENNVVALKNFSDFHPSLFEHIDSTCMFIEIFVKWWKIVNVKSAFEGIRFNDKYRNPVRIESDLQMQFLKKMDLWLNVWKQSVPAAEALTSQTFKSLCLTTKSFLKLIPYLLDKYSFDYILLGKFQNDDLEGRFGCYRQMSGCNYYISYMQVLENERKLRFKSVVLFASKHAEIKLKTLIPMQEENDESVSLDVYNSLIEEEFQIENVPNDILPVLVYIAGFCARNTMRKNNCNQCSTWLHINKEIEVHSECYEYVQDLDRGKLLLPTEFVIFSVSLVWDVVSGIIEKYNNEFITSGNQLSVVHKISCIKLSRATHMPLLELCYCNKTLESKLQCICLISSKILINNCLKITNDCRNSAKSNARKIKKLKS